MKKSSIALITYVLATLVVGLGGTGCGKPYSIKRIGYLKSFEKRYESALNSSEPSRATMQYLRLRFLTAEYEEDPAALIDKLQRETFLTNDIEVTLALTELAFLEGRKFHERVPDEAFVMYLTAAEIAFRYLLDEDVDFSEVALLPDVRLMAEIYNQSVSTLTDFALAGRDTRALVTGEQTLQTSTTFYTFALESTETPRIDPLSFDELVPANEFEVHGLTNEYISYGLGAPTVGFVEEPQQHDDWGPFYPPDQMTYPLSGLLKFSRPIERNGMRQVDCTLGFYDPLATDSLTLNDQKVPLEANFSTALAFQLTETKPLERGLTGLLHSDKLIAEAGLYLLEPYRPEKIPVVMVHGLMSSPETWVSMFNDLRGQPELRKRYQFWFFSYPTGLPILYSSLILRQQLKAVRQHFDPDQVNANFDNMVLLGHSMGGLLTRMMLIEPDNTFYDAIFDEALDQLPVSPENRTLIEDLFLFERQPNIRRAVFVATPHRGSPTADHWAAKLGAGLIKLPGNLMQSTEAILGSEEIQYSHKIKNNSKSLHTSVGLLSPTSLFMTEHIKIPLPQDVPYHSIIGIQKAQQGPGSSDGVVPYQSSHLDFADSECLVPSGHGAHSHALAIQEVKRILRQHLTGNDEQ